MDIVQLLTDAQSVLLGLIPVLFLGAVIWLVRYMNRN